MPLRRLFLVSLALCAPALPAPAAAQAPSPSPGWRATPWADSVMLETQLFFGLTSPDGKGVSEQQWTQFVNDAIAPRFPDGLTVLDAYGVAKGGALAVGTLPAALGTDTRIVILVRPNTPDAEDKIGAIKAAYTQRFGEARITQVDFPVRIAN